MLATSARAQISQFLFDANGNLGVETTAVLSAPRMLSQPRNQVVASGHAASFSIVVGDPRGVTYDWSHNGVPFPGVDNDSLTILNANAHSEGLYQVVLTNPSGSVTSAPAMLWIDDDGDGLGDSWEMAHFGNLSHNATTDLDRDGLSNLREFLDGTDPTDPNSAEYRLLVIREGGTVIKSPDLTSYAKGTTVTLTVSAPSNELFHAWLGDIVTRDNPVTLVMTNDKTVLARFTPIDFIWTNKAGGNWEVASNWAPRLVPGLNDNVFINDGATVTMNTNAQLMDVTLAVHETTLTGSGTLTVQSNLFWSKGTMSGSGRTVLATNATFEGDNQADLLLNTRTFENGGKMVWNGGFLAVGGGAVITNRPDGLFRAKNVAVSSIGGATANGRIDNAGDFRHCAGTGPLSIEAGLNLNNYGTVEIEGGALTCNSAFANEGTVTLSPSSTCLLRAGGSSRGTINLGAAGLVEWTAGTFTLESGAQCNGSGLYKINGGTLAANADVLIPNLDLVNGPGGLSGTGTLSIAHAMNWTAGTMSGSGRTVISPGATLNIPAGVSLSGRTLENGGTALVSDVAGIIFGTATITNRAGALFEIQNAPVFFFAGGPCRFDNAGIFRKSLHTGVALMDTGIAFNNSGVAEILAGTLRLTGGGSASGAFNALPSTVLEWTSGAFTLNPGAQLNGVGLYRIGGATVTDNAPLTVSNLDLTAGTLDGSGTMTIAATMNWTAGTMGGTGRTIIAPGANLNLPGSAGVFLSRTLENAGTVLWTGSGNFGVNVITNRAGAVFDVRNSAGLNTFSFNPRFDNAGIFRKAASAGTTTVGVNFTNFGTVEIQTGTLLCNGSFANGGAVSLSPGTTHRLAAGGLSVGPLEAPGTALVEWSGGTFTLNSGAALNGSGLYRINGGSLNDNAAVTVANLDLAAGALNGAAVLTIANQMNWAGGSMNGTGAGRTIIAPAATLNVGSASVLGLATRVLENGGTTVWTGSGGIQMVSAVITNRPGALFDAQSAASLSVISGARFDNDGTFRKSVSPGQVFSGINFNNSGTVDVQTGTLNLANDGAHSGGFKVSTGATLTFSGGIHSANSNASIIGNGQLTVSGARVNFAGQVNVTGTHTMSGGDANFTGTHFCTNNTVNISGGTATWSGSGLVSPAIINLSSGILRGTSAVTVGHLMNWTGGQMEGSGRTIISPAATLLVGNPGNVTLLTHTLENGGTAIWTGAGAIVLSQAVLTNRVGALFDIQTASSFASLGGPNRIDNAGLFRKSFSTGKTAVDSGVFNNFGTVDLHSGILAANNGYVSSPNALLNFAIGGTTPGAGYGQLQVAGAVTLNGALSVELIDGFVPKTNDSFNAVTAGSRSGTFANFSYPSNAVSLQLGNTPNSAVVRVTDVFTVPQPAPMPAGLISWWRAEGNALDSFGTNHGVLTNGSTFAAGQVGQAFALDGADDYVLVPDSPTLRPVSVTIEAWVKFFATNGIRIVLGKPLGSNTTFDSYGLALQDGAVLAAVCDNSGFGPFLTGPANTVTGKWYHLAYTFDDTSKQQVLYVDGAPVARGTANKTIRYDTHPLFLGADVENGVLSFFHNGLIDEASLYNRALTRDEVVTIYNAGAAGKQLSLAPPPAPSLLPPELIGADIKLTWRAVSNATYRLEFKTDLNSTNWNPLPGDMTSVSNTATKVDTLTLSNRFYRVRVVP